ncbi:MAG: DNA polymerase III subunit delta' [Betaproteobacteria bacterium]|nr:DNA polymerase III subunit delta' [Betaproteobacteria bacterium]
MIYNWQSSDWKRLYEWRGRLPHALLVQGAAGCAGPELGLTFAQSLLCQSPQASGLPCAQCASCIWFAGGNHPDFRQIVPESMLPEDPEATEKSRKEKASAEIKIDQVRDLRGFLTIGTHRAGLRLVVIHPAEAMNIRAQNAFLKSLEEPTAGTHFILVSSQADRLLPTVRSRCQRFTRNLPETRLAVLWLQEQGHANGAALLAAAGGAPLLALRHAETEPVRQRLLQQLREPGFDPIAVADLCQRHDTSEIVGWIQRWIYDLLGFRTVGRIRYHVGDEKAVARIAARCDPVALATYLRALARAKALARHTLNAKLFFEDLLIQYRSLLSGKAGAV